MKYQIDFNSETWKAIQARYSSRLEELRRKNDGLLNAEQTAHLRGRIAETKELLTLGDPVPVQIADES